MPRISRALARLLAVPPRPQPVSFIKRPSLSIPSLPVLKPLLLSRPSYLPLSIPAAWSSSPVLAAVLQLRHGSRGRGRENTAFSHGKEAEEDAKFLLVVFSKAGSI
ncbi:hypothetical protein C0995_016298 [Termitomyces sp. Mi166|nr:hypothetical protein C0995_016298 [Termitomyces sp. Mi166\